MRVAAARLLAVLSLLSAGRAAAQERPSDAEVFGEGPPQAPQQAPAPEPRPREDPLRIGGMLYLRLLGQSLQGEPPADWTLSAPALVDGYLDVRPNDRVRGYLLARLQYDLSRADSSGAAPPAGTPGGIGGSGTAISTAQLFQTQNPRMLLDQLWVNFDVERRVFVTAGRQHVKWGTGHFWNPTDFLHAVRRDPLAVFDARTGTTMLKVHVPWEKRGWNFYGMGVLDESQPIGLVRNVGAGGRAEVVLGTAELGIDGLVQRDRDPRVGVDFSAGIWDLDVYGEAALRKGSDVPLYRPAGSIGTLAIGAPYEPSGLRPAITGGASWSYKYSDEDAFTVGAEYFYNANGYPDASLYPYLLYQEQLTGQLVFTPFYLGQHYAGVYFLLPNPGSWNNTTFTLSTIGNLSDRSFVSRIDYAVVVLTYLRIEAYVGAHWGTRGGEFRFAVDVSGVPNPSDPAAPISIHVPPPVLDFGAALRVNM